MKKFFFMMLVVLMGGMMASCGSDSDSDDSVETYTLLIAISEPGTMPEIAVEAFNELCKQNQIVFKGTLSSAKNSLDKTFATADLSTYPLQYDYTVEFALYDSKGKKVYSRYVEVKNGKATKI